METNRIFTMVLLGGKLHESMQELLKQFMNKLRESNLFSCLFPRKKTYKSGNKLPPFFFTRQSLQTQELPWSLAGADGLLLGLLEGGFGRLGVAVNGVPFVGVLAWRLPKRFWCSL
ncbi:uncharacterized protein METZ01_LOCUS441106 [marine metagenome]|uniref:Uncharacterized protein n=1 Tax=marine metagenome TaxID=408172 RepID=A0A382YYC6_9ZZZZ